MSASGTETGKTTALYKQRLNPSTCWEALAGVPQYRATVYCNGSLGSLEHMLGEVSHDA